MAFVASKVAIDAPAATAAAQTNFSEGFMGFTPALPTS
jgi:hypothetical protein